MAQNGGGGRHQHQQHLQQHQSGRIAAFGPEASSIFGRRTGLGAGPAGAPLLPITSAPTTIPFLPVTMATTSSSSSSSSQQQQRRPEVAANNGRDLISLSQPRPGIARVRNEYIETPLRPPPSSPQCSLLLPQSSSSSSSSSQPATKANAKPSAGPIGVHSHRRPPPPPPSSAPAPPLSPSSSSSSSTIQRQQQNSIRELIQLPQSRSALNSGSNTRSSSNNNNNTLSKSGNNDVVVVVDFSNDLKGSGGVGLAITDSRHPSAATTGTLQQQQQQRQQLHQFQPLQPRQLPQHQDSIICRDCRRCKCVACGSPRPLPAAWICRDRYQCSAETLLDQFTCMCCVKGVFYHATSDEMDDGDDDANCADRPCSCHPHRRCTRWACVGLLTVALPCLLCYWPLRGCLRLCEWCYAEYSSRHACQCARRRGKSNATSSSSATTTTTTPSTTATAASVITVPPGGGGSTKRLLHQQDDEEQDRLRLG